MHARSTRLVTTTPCPQLAAKSSYPKLPSSHLALPAVGENLWYIDTRTKSERAAVAQPADRPCTAAPSRRMFCHRVGRIPGHSHPHHPKPPCPIPSPHKPPPPLFWPGARCRALTYARLNGPVGREARHEAEKKKKDRKSRRSTTHTTPHPNRPTSAPLCTHTSFPPLPIPCAKGANQTQLFRWGSIYLLAGLKSYAMR